jgi:hypothetical protein
MFCHFLDMGLIRGGLLFVVGILFLGALIAGGVFYTVQSSLDEDILKADFVSVAGESLEENYNLSSEIEDNLDEMELYCMNNTVFAFNHSELEKTLVIPCGVVAQGTDAIVDYGLNSLVDEVYSEQPFLAKDYWTSKFYYSLVGILILFGVIWLLVERKVSSLVVAGALFVLASLPFLALDSIASFFVAEGVFQVFGSLLLGAHSVFTFMLVLGLILTGVGIGLRFWTFGSTKKKFSRNEVQKIVREEVKKK